MNFSNQKEYKYIPEFGGNRESDRPCAVYYEKMDAREMSIFNEESVKNKDTNADYFVRLVKRVENFFLVDEETGESVEVTNPADIIQIPGIYKLVSEVCFAFNELNYFEGEKKK